jgi:hypothetical protein
MVGSNIRCLLDYLGLSQDGSHKFLFPQGWSETAARYKRHDKVRRENKTAAPQEQPLKIV